MKPTNNTAKSGMPATGEMKTVKSNADCMSKPMDAGKASGGNLGSGKGMGQDSADSNYYPGTNKTQIDQSPAGGFNSSYNSEMDNG